MVPEVNGCGHALARLAVRLVGEEQPRREVRAELGREPGQGDEHDAMVRPTVAAVALARMPPRSPTAAIVSPSASTTPSAGTMLTSFASRSSWSTTPGQATNQQRASAGPPTHHARDGRPASASRINATATIATGKLRCTNARLSRCRQAPVRDVVQP